MFGTGQNRNLEQKKDYLFHRNECMVDQRFIPYPRQVCPALLDEREQKVHIKYGFDIRYRAGEWLISAIRAWTS